MRSALDTWSNVAQDPAFHFPPDVFEALVTAIPLINRGRKDVLVFFQGCGADRSLLTRLAQRMDADRAFGKYPATREVLIAVNEVGDTGLAVRREVIKRVSEFENFAACWPSDQLKAQGAVATVRDLVNKKDAFTQMRNVRDEELRQHQQEQAARVKAENDRRAERLAVRNDLYALFGMADAQRRGLALEGVLNRLFSVERIKVRDAFVVRTPTGSQIEQIDGVVTIDSQLYLVEMKWWKEKLQRGDVASHLVSAFNRGGVNGILIAASGYEDSAIEDCREALTRFTEVLVDLEEIVEVLDDDGSVLNLLRSKIEEAKLRKNPYFRPGGNRLSRSRAPT
jgi:restriction system protein